ncbi:MAG: hypothetical protein B6U94_06670 [Thermofilum sp. ex4484_79]|nr:MAG: hypothetical protein B6U94_06670 [Thermofilum sp. ex4484_79]RLE71982.1 MAG: hypothetical protein DRZ80_07785 [Thermoprotei archaeon]
MERLKEKYFISYLMMFETLLLLSGQLLLYFLPPVSWESHWYLWLTPPILIGFITPSLKKGLSASLVASILYILIAGSIEGAKHGSWIGGIVFGFIFGLPIMFILNIISVTIAYGVKYGLKKILRF